MAGLKSVNRSSCLTLSDGTFQIENGVLVRCCDPKIRVAVLPFGTEKIEKGAFVGCSKLVSLTLPESLEAISDRGLLGAESLFELVNNSRIEIKPRQLNIDCNARSVHSGESAVKKVDDYLFIRYSGENFLLAYEGKEAEPRLPDYFEGEGYVIHNRAFEKEEKIEKITLGGGVKRICEYAFYGCLRLREVKLPDGLEDIENYAFEWCCNLRKINIPHSVKYVGYRAFGNCEKLATAEDGIVYISGRAIEKEIFTGGNRLNDYTYRLREDTVAIGRPFREMPAIKQIRIPEGVRVIEEYAFVWCENLSEICIPDSTVYIGNGAFSKCVALKYASLSNSISEIAPKLFFGCRALVKADIPSAVKKIGERAFAGCSSLPAVSIPRGVTEIEDRAFESCTGLQSIVIPKMFKPRMKDIFPEEIFKLFGGVKVTYT